MTADVNSDSTGSVYPVLCGQAAFIICMCAGILGCSPTATQRSSHSSESSRESSSADEAATSGSSTAEVDGAADSHEHGSNELHPESAVSPAIVSSAEEIAESIQRADLHVNDAFNRALEGLDDVHGRPAPPDRSCTYTTYNWSTAAGRSVNHRQVQTTIGRLPDDGRDPEDPRCTICQEDQRTLDPSEIGIAGVEPVEVCAAYYGKIRDALQQIANSDQFDIQQLSAYRVGRTRGRIVDGLRTELSNHSYGSAIDINAHHNGLYGGCYVSEVNLETLSSCGLRVGGRWNPDTRPRTTVTADGMVYRIFTEDVGWRWGGEIEGGTRDMMHFSLTGY